MSPLEYSLLPVAMFVYSTITMLELPEWPETRGLAVSTSYEDRKYRPFHHSENPTSSPPTKLVGKPVHSGTLAFSLFGHSWLT
jgi:hypothetical protein